VPSSHRNKTSVSVSETIVPSLQTVLFSGNIRVAGVIGSIVFTAVLSSSLQDWLIMAVNKHIEIILKNLFIAL
jgi:hypothetical protein